MTNRSERGDYDDEIEALGGRIYRMSPIKPGNYRKYFKELPGLIGDILYILPPKASISLS